ncbi:MAG: hypothetical protein ACOCZK_04060 [Planctomycetota bacterium]
MPRYACRIECGADRQRTLVIHAESPEAAIAMLEARGLSLLPGSLHESSAISPLQGLALLAILVLALAQAGYVLLHERPVATPTEHAAAPEPADPHADQPGPAASLTGAPPAPRSLDQLLRGWQQTDAGYRRAALSLRLDPAQGHLAIALPPSPRPADLAAVQDLGHSCARLSGADPGSAQRFAGALARSLHAPQRAFAAGLHPPAGLRLRYDPAEQVIHLYLNALARLADDTG